MSIPFGLNEFSLWLAIVSIILLVTSEILSPKHRRIQVFASQNKLRKIAFAFFILFFMAILIRLVGILA